MAVQDSIVIELTPSIRANNQLQLTFLDVNTKRVLWRPRTGIDNLVALRGQLSSLTIEICDFFQFGSLYSVYGAVLGEDSDVVAAYWESTGRGQRYTVARPSELSPRLLIGAAPRMPGAPVPAAFQSWAPGGGLPGDDTRPVGD
jgi:hypothetical protein